MGGRDPMRDRTSLYGRGSECSLLDDVIGALRGGESRTLLIHGEAGIGKTALLNSPRGFGGRHAPASAAGVESEMELPFASLHQLCAPLLDHRGQLPPPQRDALEVAFGRTAGPAPDRFLVGLAVLTLLSEAAEDRPVLCVVDDAQWLDEVSAKTLAFVARRLVAEPVGLVFAAREPTGELRGLPELEVLGLRERGRACASAFGRLFRLDERVRDRIVAETRGNPLALLELPRGLTAEQLAGGFGLLEARATALPTRLEESFRRRVEAIPDHARLLLLVAAAEPVGDPVLVRRAAERARDRYRRSPPRMAAHYRGVGDVPASACPLRGLPICARRAAQERAPRSGGGDRWGRRSRPSGMASGRGRPRPRRGGRSGAGTVAPVARTARGGVAAAAAFLQRALGLTADQDRRTERARSPRRS